MLPLAQPGVLRPASCVLPGASQTSREQRWPEVRLTPAAPANYSAARKACLLPPCPRGKVLSRRRFRRAVACRSARGPEPRRREAILRPWRS